MLLLDRQAVVRTHQLSKVLLPECQSRLVIRVRHVFRQLLPVTGIEICEHFSDQCRRLSADIALTV